MVEYRLIKCYPNSPRLGTVVNYSDAYKIYNTNGGSFYTELPKHQVENLPEFWEKVIDKDGLLKEAETRYPKGTKYYAINRNRYVDLNWNVGMSTGKFTYIDNGSIHITSENNKSVYFNGKWAEVKEEPLFTTEDGVDIYEGDKYWMSSADFYIIPMKNADIEAGQSKYYKYFSTKKAAQKYINTFKPKYSEDDMKAFALEAILDGVSLNEWKRRHGKA